MTKHQELLAQAKDLGIAGAHKMTTAGLEQAIAAEMAEDSPAAPAPAIPEAPTPAPAPDAPEGEAAARPEALDVSGVRCRCLRPVRVIADGQVHAFAADEVATGHAALALLHTAGDAVEAVS